MSYFTEESKHIGSEFIFTLSSVIAREFDSFSLISAVRTVHSSCFVLFENPADFLWTVPNSRQCYMWDRTRRSYQSPWWFSCLFTFRYPRTFCLTCWHCSFGSLVEPSCLAVTAMLLLSPILAASCVNVRSALLEGFVFLTEEPSALLVYFIHAEIFQCCST